MTLKGKLVETTIHIDCRCTGGPLIPKGTQAVVKVVRRTGELWVEFLPTAAGDRFGHRHVYGYLEGDWERGKHRKWCGLLTKEQFEGFVNSTGLIADSTETMGSIGAPGFGFGWSPAISFRDDGQERAILPAYVTPIPEVKKERSDERDWQRVRRAVLSVFGNN